MRVELDRARGLVTGGARRALAGLLALALATQWVPALAFAQEDVVIGDDAVERVAEEEVASVEEKDELVADEEDVSSDEQAEELAGEEPEDAQASTDNGEATAHDDQDDAADQPVVADLVEDSEETPSSESSEEKSGGDIAAVPRQSARSVRKTASITMSTYATKMNAFINDARWAHGTYWPQIPPKLSTYDCLGCFAYACDFTTYVYGVNNYRDGTAYYSVSEIRTGDVIRISGHTFVVLERNGNNLYTAEGAFSNAVRVANPGYIISGNGLTDTWGNGKSFETGYHFDITTDSLPVGYLDVCEGVDAGVHVKGWTYDPDAPSQSLSVDVYLDGVFWKRLTANKARTDVNNAHGISGNHGYEETISTTSRGLHTIVVYSLNEKSDGGNPALAMGNGSTSARVVICEPQGSAVTTLPAGRYLIVSKNKPTDGLDVQGASTEDKTDVILHTWNANKTHQQFDVSLNSDSTYKISPVHSGAAVEVTEADASNGANVAQYVDHGSAAQKWWAFANSDGTWSFKCKGTGLALGYDTATSSVKTYTYNASSAVQHWYLVPLDAGNWDVTVPSTGTDREPVPTVKAGGLTLTSGTNYDVTYRDNDGVGMATLTVAGKNGFTGAIDVPFTIERELVDLSSDGWKDLSGGHKAYVKDGKQVFGWLDLGDMKYYFDEGGAMVAGRWYDLDNGQGQTMHYYFRPSGNLARGWADVDGTKYYFRPSGNMAVGWADVDGKKYYFGPDGAMLVGWQSIDNGEGATNRYYFRPSGAMAVEWATIDGDNYYFRPSGNMAVGFADVVSDAYKRYFDEDGRMVTGWREIGGNTYYFRSSGAMQTGEATIDGQACTFSAKGVLLG